MERANTNHWRIVLMLLVLTFVSGWAGLRTIPPIDRHEARFAQSSVQMIETGDFVQSRFLGDTAHRKPAGVHWLQAGAVSVFSYPEARSIWAYRLPSLWGAMLAVLATYAAGVLLLGQGPAAAGASLFAVSVMLGAEAGIAKADAALTGFTALAMTALAGLYCGKDRGYALLFWGALAAATLVKGLVAPVAVSMAILTITVVDRRAGWLKPLAWWPGPLLAAAIAAPWLIAIYRVTGGAFFVDTVTTDIAPKIWSDEVPHVGWPLYHSSLLPILFWPGTMFLAPGVALTALAFFPRVCARKRDLRRVAALGLEEASRAAALRFLAAWALPIWLMFELVPFKMAHHVLPIYPALALMTGAGVYWLFTRRPPSLRVMAPGMVYTLLLFVVPVFLTVFAGADGARLAFPLLGFASGIAIASVTRPEEPLVRPSIAIDAGLVVLLIVTVGAAAYLTLPPLFMNLTAFIGALSYGLALSRRTPRIDTITPGILYTFAFLAILAFVAVGVGLAGALLALQTAVATWSGGPLDMTALASVIDIDLDRRTMITMAAVGAGLPLIFAPIILRGAPRTALVAACAAGIAWQWAARGYVAPKLETLFVSNTISEELEGLSLHPLRSAGAARPLVATGYSEPSLAFLTDTSTILADPEVAALIAAGEVGRAAVVEERMRERFEAALFMLEADMISVGEADGFNYPTGEPVTLWIYRTIRAAPPENIERATAAMNRSQTTP